MENEIWKPVVGYEGLYEISNLGNVKSLNYHNTGRSQLLSLTTDSSGYLKCKLIKDGATTTVKVHRLVAQAFIPNPYDLPQINHKDEVKTNNSVSNLEWCSASYNHDYGTRTERMTQKMINHPSVSSSIICMETGVEYPSMAEASRQTGIERSNIGRVCRGKLLTAGGFHWRYA